MLGILRVRKLILFNSGLIRSCTTVISSTKKKEIDNIITSTNMNSPSALHRPYVEHHHRKDYLEV